MIAALQKLDPGSVGCYVQLPVGITPSGETAVSRVHSFLEEGLLTRFRLVDAVLPALAEDATVLLVGGHTQVEQQAPDDQGARRALLTVLAHAVRADRAPVATRVRVLDHTQHGGGDRRPRPHRAGTEPGAAVGAVGRGGAGLRGLAHRALRHGEGRDLALAGSPVTAEHSHDGRTGIAVLAQASGRGRGDGNAGAGVRGVRHGRRHGRSPMSSPPWRGLPLRPAAKTDGECHDHQRFAARRRRRHLAARTRRPPRPREGRDPRTRRHRRAAAQAPDGRDAGLHAGGREGARSGSPRSSTASRS